MFVFTRSSQLLELFISPTVDVNRLVQFVLFHGVKRC